MLDKSKPYGVVTGENGVAFEQAGKQFDADGNEVGSEVVAEPKRAGRPKKSVDDQIAAQGE